MHPSRTNRRPRPRPNLFPGQSFEDAAARFRVLSVPARLRILDALMAGPATVGALVEATGLEQSNLSRHVAALERGGCVRRQPRGRTVVVRVTDPTLRRLCRVVCGSLRAMHRR